MATHNRSDATVSSKAIQEGVWARCAECGKETHHDVLACFEEYDANDDADIQVWNNFQTIRCRGCLRISFRTTAECTEDQEYDPFTGQVTLRTQVALYPDSERSRQPIAKAHRIPSEVRRAYIETLAAASSDLRVLVGIGIRAIVESVCKDKQAKGRNLELKIDDLVAQGLMPKPAADLLHGTRLLGNKCAHEAEPLTEESLSAALQVVEHLLQTVYVMPDLAAQLPKRSMPKPEQSPTPKRPKPKPKQTPTRKKTPAD
ncbi:MAG: DUF4145 domain-containing protein [Myxococcales bacterium]|nr:DUF4145 domain-containing protein [Myxococcales bacterium]MCA9633300.1 DUF4145 domain-containing protein [Myxococcales bacterium]